MIDRSNHAPGYAKSHEETHTRQARRRHRESMRIHKILELAKRDGEQIARAFRMKR